MVSSSSNGPNPSAVPAAGMIDHMGWLFKNLFQPYAEYFAKMNVIVPIPAKWTTGPGCTGDV